jgi:hypothetical protein
MTLMGIIIRLTGTAAEWPRAIATYATCRNTTTSSGMTIWGSGTSGGWPRQGRDWPPWRDLSRILLTLRSPGIWPDSVPTERCRCTWCGNHEMRPA